MKQIIAKNRTEAVKFANGGSIHVQRAAYWKSKGVAYRAERCPGERECRISENVGGNWWSAKKTIAQKLGLMKNKTAFCIDHTGPGGRVRHWTDVPRDQQVKRVALTLARRKWGKLAVAGTPRLLSVDPASLDSLYSCKIANKPDFFNSKEDTVILRLPRQSIM